MFKFVSDVGIPCRTLRNIAGEAQNVRGSMLEAAIAYIGEEAIAASLNLPLVRWGNRHPDLAPHGVFPTHNPDRWVAVVCKSDDTWRRLKSLIGFQTDKFDKCSDRLRHVDEVEELVSSWTQTQSSDDVVKVFHAARVSAVAVVDTLEILAHPEFTSRNWIKKQSHPDVRDIWHSGFAWRFLTELSADLPPPRLGEHSAQILAELGYSAKRINALFTNDTIGTVLTR